MPARRHRAAWPDILDGVREALALVLDSARWFIAAVGRSTRGISRRPTGSEPPRSAADVVPFTDFWMIVNEALFGTPPVVIEPAVRGLRERWATVLDLPPGAQAGPAQVGRPA